MRASLALAFATAAACAGRASEGPPAGGALGRATGAPVAATEPPGLVVAELLADVDAIAPGQRFTIGVALTPPPGYHIYWLNPGDSGLATEVRFRLPDRFALGPARFEGPTAFTSPDGAVSYGYPGTTIVSTEVEAPSDLPGSIEATVEVAYAACKDDECVPGTSDAALVLPRAAAVAATPGRAAGRLREHAARLPRPFAELAGARAAWRRFGAHHHLKLVVPEADALTYFPSPGDEASYDGAFVVLGAPSDALLRFKTASAPAVVSGVLRLEVGGAARYYQLAIPAGPR